MDLLFVISTNVIAFAIGCAFMYGRVMSKQRGECPRMALGYNCKGSDCDHSFRAQMEIKKDFDRG